MTSSRQTIKETLWSCNPYGDDEDGLPQNVVELVAWLQEQIKAVAPEFVDDLWLTIESDYDSSRLDMEMFYERPETDDELIKRVQAETERQRANQLHEETKERMVYERLKAKYG